MSQLKKSQSSATGIGASIFFTIIVSVIIMILFTKVIITVLTMILQIRICDRHQPSNRWLLERNEDCAYIKTNEKWNDFSCTKKKWWHWTINPLCEKPTKRQPTIIVTTKKPETNASKPNESEINPTAIKGDNQNKKLRKTGTGLIFSLRTLSDFQTFCNFFCFCILLCPCLHCHIAYIRGKRTNITII